MSRKPQLRPRTGTLTLEHGKLDYDSEKECVLVAGTIEGCKSDGVGVNLRLLREAIAVAIDRFYPDAPKKAMYPAEIWIDTNSSTKFPVVVIAEECDDCDRRKGVVIATTWTSPRRD